LTIAPLADPIMIASENNKNGKSNLVLIFGFLNDINKITKQKAVNKINRLANVA
jgi:hypothetical protein